jgi:NADPH-dependent 2,4-dienoyl-CoA reductase/sulfur reductase-like enzyme
MKHDFDVVIVGAGPAGLSAAQAAVRAGARVALLDDNPRAGGQVWRHGPAHPMPAPLRGLQAQLQDPAALTSWPSARVVALPAPRTLLVELAGQRGMRVGYRTLILCTGARERLLPFSGWTLPGVTGAGGLQALIKGGVPVRGERIVMAGSGPLLLAALATARAAGAQVLAVVEQAPAAAVARFALSLGATPAKLRQAVQLTRGFPLSRYWSGSVVRAAHGTAHVEAVTVLRGAREVTLDCERVACGYGLVPESALARALGCAIDASGAVVVDDAQRTSIADVLAAGECTGVGGMELARVEGEIAGWHAGGRADAAAVCAGERARWRRFAQRVARAFALRDAARTPPPDDTLLCRCEDVPFGDVARRANWRDAKLQTRCGMGACQGRVCGSAAETYFGWQSAQVRPPVYPARISTLMAATDDGAPE